MSVPFTDISNAGAVGEIGKWDYTNREFLLQIHNAITERGQMCGVNVPEEFRMTVDGVGAQSCWYVEGYLGWQALIQQMYQYFIRPEPDYTGLDLFAYDTDWEGFLEDAGLNPLGFRRAVEWDPLENDWTNPSDPMFEYGFLERGDIIGPWLFVDLQKALSAMTVTFRRAPSGPGGLQQRLFQRSFYGQNRDCAVARQDAIDSWTAAEWIETGTGFGVYSFQLQWRNNSMGNYYQFSGRRLYGHLVREPDADIPHIPGGAFVVDLYVRGPSALPLSPDYPLTGVNQLLLVKGASVEGETVVFGKVETPSPVEAANLVCPVTVGTLNSSFDPYWWEIVRHDPTHSN